MYILSNAQWKETLKINHRIEVPKNITEEIRIGGLKDQVDCGGGHVDGEPGWDHLYS